MSFGHQQCAWYHDFGGTDSMFTLCAAGRLSLLPVKLDFRDNQRGYSRPFIICTCTIKYYHIFFTPSLIIYHTPYSRIIMCQKWEGDCGLWDLNEIIKKIYTESLKKIVGAVWELPAK